MLLKSDDSMIQCHVQPVNCKYAFEFSFVYGLHTAKEREPLWEDMKRITRSVNGPWMLLGDFNVVLNPDENK